MELGQDDSGGGRTVNIGDEVVVALPENPTTGYRWQPESVGSGLRESGDRFDGPTDLRGAPGMRYLSFTGVTPGEVRLRLVKRRAWESGPGIEEFWVDLDIQEGRGDAD